MFDIEERDHARGPADAEINLLEYGDFQCQHCGAAYPVMKQLQQGLGATMRFVFREFPLMNVHEFAEMAAESAEAAGAQGHFWEMHDYLFEHQRELSMERLARAAGDLGLDVQRYMDDMNRRLYSGRVRQDMRSGMGEGVHGTPAFFINGVQHEGRYDFDTLMEAIEGHRRRAAA